MQELLILNCPLQKKTKPLTLVSCYDRVSYPLQVWFVALLKHLCNYLTWGIEVPKAIEDINEAKDIVDKTEKV